jgi:protein LTV1
MQHLRPVGLEEEGVESILIEAPSSTKAKNKGKAKAPISLRDLPPEVLPSSTELPLDYSSQDAIPESISGLHPDMDPHLRQTLEALEDEEFVDDELEDDFFGELIAGGERDEDDEPDYEFEEYGVAEEASEESSGHEEEDTFEARFAKFKKEQKNLPPPSDTDSDLDAATEGGDTVTQLPQIHVIGGKRRRKGTSEASGYSMSSSSMVRNEALQTLDERFDQVSFMINILKFCCRFEQI